MIPINQTRNSRKRVRTGYAFENATQNVNQVTWMGQRYNRLRTKLPKELAYWLKRNYDRSVETGNELSGSIPLKVNRTGPTIKIEYDVSRHFADGGPRQVAAPDRMAITYHSHPIPVGLVDGITPPSADDLAIYIQNYPDKNLNCLLYTSPSPRD